MKQIILLFLVAVAGSAANAQTIRIADNNANAPTGANVYTTLQAAINAAVPDDIVYITPSVTSYGNATVGKRITIKGVGFGIAEIAPRSSTIGTLTIVNSSNGTDNVSGLKLTGFSFGSIDFSLGIGSSPYNNIEADNITGNFFSHQNCVQVTDGLTIKNSVIYQILIGICSGTSNTLIYKNVITGNLDVRNSSTVVITNNLFTTASYAINTEGSSPGVRIEHNIFSGTTAPFARIVNALVVNNIFFGNLPNNGGNGSPFHSNTFSNNLVLDPFTFPPAALGGPGNSGVNNIAGTGPLFTNAPVSSTYNSTYNYTLQGGSPCIGSATTGENIGPSGGLYPWTGNLTLKATAVPVITLFGNSGVVPQNQPLKSNIKANAN